MSGSGMPLLHCLPTQRRPPSTMSPPPQFQGSRGGSRGMSGGSWARARHFLAGDGESQIRCWRLGGWVMLLDFRARFMQD